MGRLLMPICMASATRDKDGKLISRIVPNLSPGALVGTLACHVDYVVTENGIAGPMDGLSIDERAEALIKVAHPELQDELMKGAKEKGLFK